jgi:hypothetical protein
MTVGDIADRILEAAASELRDVERQEIMAYVRAAASKEPTADLWYLIGHAVYHLWRPPRDPALLVEALEALNRALRLDPGHEWSRLHRIYLQFEQGELAGCLADARVLDRSWFLGTPVEWRVISADEIEFACLVRLGIATDRLPELYRRIVDLATPDDDDLWPYRPSTFVEALEDAWLRGLFPEPDVPAMKAEIADLMARIDQ